jgi:hypothetical protein
MPSKPLTITLDTTLFDSPGVVLPEVWTVTQTDAAPALGDIVSAVREAIAIPLSDARIRPGAHVAIGSGSRGIANLTTIVKEVVNCLNERGAIPFIVPAMGSHGGATAEGQKQILEDYGITEEFVGAPIQATMEVEEIAQLDDGYPVYFDRNALAADAVIVINRIKPHTDFAGRIESGLGKMCAIGLGKQKGASSIHKFGAQGLRDVMPQVARKLVEHAPIVGGVAIIENSFGQTAEIHGLAAADFAMPAEERLLQRARDLSPMLPLSEIDVLVIDEMGKDISGSGMDTHVIGRLRMPSMGEDEWDGPKTRVICTLDLTDRSHGNAAGIGLADMVTRKLMEKVDFHATFMNHATSGEGGVYRGSLPIVLEDAEACVRSAIARCGQGHEDKVRLVRIRNTECVQRFEVSAAVLSQLDGKAGVVIDENSHALNVLSKLDAGHREAE